MPRKKNMHIRDPQNVNSLENRYSLVVIIHIDTSHIKVISRIQRRLRLASVLSMMMG